MNADSSSVLPPSGVPAVPCRRSIFFRLASAGLSSWLLLLLQTVPATGTVVTNCEPAELEAAVANGGVVRFGCSGTIRLTRPLQVTTNTVLDGGGQTVMLDGGHATRLIEVGSGVRLTLLDLTLMRGGQTGGRNAASQAEADASAGAILVNGGSLYATSCRFVSNRVEGGDNGGQLGGTGRGGAIRMRSGGAELADCEFSGNTAIGGPIVSLPPFPMGGFGAGQGGAICTDGESGIRLTRCSFDSNTAVGASCPLSPGSPGGDAFGGALYCAGGWMDLRDCRFAGNSVQPGSAPRSTGAGHAGGGAIHLAATVTGASMTGTEFTNNLCRGGTGLLGYTEAPGGAIYAAASLGCEACVFRNNRAVGTGNRARGGAIFGSATLLLRDCTFLDNRAEGGPGGGPSADDGFPALGGAVCLVRDAVITGSTFSGNQALGGAGNTIVGQFNSNGGDGRGGAIYAAAGLALMNSTFEGNRAVGGLALGAYGFVPGGGDGGALKLAAGPVAGTNLTFAANQTLGGSSLTTQRREGPAHGGAVSMDQPAAVTLLNSVFASAGPGGNCFPTFASGRNNLSSDDTCGFAALGGKDGVDAHLDVLADYGGPTPTMALLADSPAIDVLEPADTPATDQRGTARPYGSRGDLGAYEWIPLYAIRGTITGVPDPQNVVVRVGSRSTAPGADGRYVVTNVPPEPVNVSAGASNHRFLPEAVVITAGPDDGVADFHGYPQDTLVVERAADGLTTVRYAGPVDFDWVIEGSADLRTWLPLATNRTDTAGWGLMPGPAGAGTPPQFLRARR